MNISIIKWFYKSNTIRVCGRESTMGSLSAKVQIRPGEPDLSPPPPPVAAESGSL